MSESDTLISGSDHAKIRACRLGGDLGLPTSVDLAKVPEPMPAQTTYANIKDPKITVANHGFDDLILNHWLCGSLLLTLRLCTVGHCGVDSVI